MKIVVRILLYDYWLWFSIKVSHVQSQNASLSLFQTPTATAVLLLLSAQNLFFLLLMTFRVWFWNSQQELWTYFPVQIGVLIHDRFFHHISKQLLSLLTKYQLVLDYNSRLAAVSILQWDASWHTEWSPLLWLVALINEISTSQRHQHNISGSSCHELLWHEACACARSCHGRV